MNCAIQRTWWGLLWHSENAVDGVTEHLLWEGGFPALFRTRREARDYAAKKYGYIKTRRDLQAEPHGWRLPRPVRVEFTLRRK